MPATKYAAALREEKDPIRHRRLRGLLAKGMAETGVSRTQLAAAMSMSEDTFGRRWKNPDSFTLGEMHAAEKILHTKLLGVET